jgi:hypothetical protein
VVSTLLNLWTDMLDQARTSSSLALILLHRISAPSVFTCYLNNSSMPFSYSG